MGGFQASRELYRRLLRESRELQGSLRSSLNRIYPNAQSAHAAAVPGVLAAHAKLATKTRVTFDAAFALVLFDRTALGMAGGALHSSLSLSLLLEAAAFCGPSAPDGHVSTENPLWPKYTCQAAGPASPSEQPEWLANLTPRALPKKPLLTS